MNYTRMKKPMDTYLSSGAQQVRRFLAPSWLGPVFQPVYGAEYDERLPRPPQRLALEVFERNVSWVATLAGEATYKNGDHRVRLRPGSVFVYERPDPGVILHPPAGKRWHHLWLTVSGEPALAFVRHITRLYGPVQMLAPNPECVRLARKLLKLAAEQPERDARFWSVKTHEWLNAWWREVEPHTPPLASVLKGGEEARRVSLSSGTLKRMAERLGYSRSYLGRRLKRMWDGQTPGAMIRRARLEEASKLLRETRGSIVEISKQVGYARSSSFITAFKAQFGKSPLRYRHDREW